MKPQLSYKSYLTDQRYVTLPRFHCHRDEAVERAYFMARNAREYGDEREVKR